jgi:hypothetical protein
MSDRCHPGQKSTNGNPKEQLGQVQSWARMPTPQKGELPPKSWVLQGQIPAAAKEVYERSEAE